MSSTSEKLQINQNNAEERKKEKKKKNERKKRKDQIMLLFERVERCKCFLILGQIRWIETLSRKKEREELIAVFQEKAFASLL